MPQPKHYASHAERQAAYRNRCKRARNAELAAKGLPAMPAISTMPGWPRWNAALNMAHEIISTTASEMQDYFDDRSEAWQESEQADAHQEKIEAIQAILDMLGEHTT
jgi:hypothetical protein